MAVYSSGLNSFSSSADDFENFERPAINTSMFQTLLIIYSAIHSHLKLKERIGNKSL